ncbi:MAG: hypothetical protein AB7S26_29950 [Sandaracinaceae bacterium]
MAFRDNVHALQSRIETLEVALRSSDRRAAALEAELAELRTTIMRLRSGLADEEALRKDRHLAASEALLPLAGILGVLFTLAVATVFAPYHFHGHIQIDAVGMRNFLTQLQQGGLGTMLLTLAALPLAILPSLASVGMHMRKKFGWYAAMLAWAIWTLPCPPLGLYGLFALGRKPVRDLLLVEPMKAPEARVEVPPYDQMRVRYAPAAHAGYQPEEQVEVARSIERTDRRSA